MNKILLTFILAFISAEIVSAATDKVVCYYGSWAIWRSGNGNFAVEDIDPSLCTHLIYSFVGINDDGSIDILDPILDIDKKNIQRFNNLKQKNKNLKTLVAIGGWNQGSSKFSAVAASSTKRAAFIQNAVNFVKKYGFDGFDLDWEYPAQRGGAAADKKNFATLIKELRQEFDKNGLLLTAAVVATSGSVDISYDVPALSKYLDFINVMTYDFHGSWDGVTGQNAPLYPSSSESDYQKLLNVDASIKGWLERGADPQKLVLGLGVYGRTYTLQSSSNHKVGAATIGAGNGGPYTLEAGKLGYNEIVELQSQGGWTTVWDDEQKTPYTYKGNQWVGYDNLKSIGIKADYAKSKNLGGLMIWSIETDDFKGIGGTKFAILKAINQALGNTATGNSANEQESEPEPEPAPEPASEPENDTSSGSVCKKVGYVRDPAVCSIFYYCVAHNGGFVPLQLECSSGLVFDEASISCNYPHLVQC